MSSKYLVNMLGIVGCGIPQPTARPSIRNHRPHHRVNVLNMRRTNVPICSKGLTTKRKPGPNGHTFGTPNLCCLGGKHDGPSTILRCSENGTHASSSQQRLHPRIKTRLANIADTPRNCALLARGRGLVSLALDAQVHNVIPADGAVVHHYVPGP
jgi:hypothetical protein